MSTSDLNYWYDEYAKEEQQFKGLVEKLKNIATSSNIKAIENAAKECEVKSLRVKEVKKSFGLELKLIRDRAIRKDYEEKCNAIDEDFDIQFKEFTRLKSSNQRQDLFSTSNTTSTTNPYSTEGKNNDQLLNEAHRIQDLTFESLTRTKNMIEASKEIGSATVEQLRTQRDQIIEIEKEVDALDSNLVRAEKLIVNFTRRMATDRIIQLFTAINIVVLLGLILYVVISGRSLSASSKSSGGLGPGATSRPSISPTMAPTSGSIFQNQDMETYLRRGNNLIFDDVRPKILFPHAERWQHMES
jgi:hypothetical protein